MKGIGGACYDDFELIACLSNRLDLSKGLEGALPRPSIVYQAMMQICRCKIDDPSKSISRVSVLDYSLCADLDVRAQWVSNQLLTPGSSFGVTAPAPAKGAGRGCSRPVRRPTGDLRYSDSPPDST